MYNEMIDWIDLFLVPAYVLVVVAILWFIKKRHPENELYRKYLIKGFIFKIICAMFYAFLLYFYYGFGDSLTYFKDAIYFKHLIRTGADSFMHLMNDDYKSIRETHNVIGGGSSQGLAVEKVALLLSYISFNRYLVVTVLFASIAYSGVFKLYQAMCDMMPDWHKRLAIFILFFPTMSVFGSGVLKDTLCMAGLGWMFYAGHKVFLKKQFSIKNILIIIAGASVLVWIKVYILAAFIVPYILYLLIILLRKIPSKFIRRTIMPLFLVLLVGIYIMKAKEIDESLGYYAVEKLFDNLKEQQTNYIIESADAGGMFELGEFEPTISGFLKKMPDGIVATLYRPFPWEAKKLIMVFSALESMCLLILTLYVLFKAGFRKFFSSIISNPFTFLCISYSLLFAALIGLSTFNFGTLARYRIPIIPFYVAGLFSIIYADRNRVPKKHRHIVLPSAEDQTP
jgi:hypothetical protein